MKKIFTIFLLASVLIPNIAFGGGKYFSEILIPFKGNRSRLGIGHIEKIFKRDIIANAGGIYVIAFIPPPIEVSPTDPVINPQSVLDMLRYFDIFSEDLIMELRFQGKEVDLTMLTSRMQKGVRKTLQHLLTGSNNERFELVAKTFLKILFEFPCFMTKKWSSGSIYSQLNALRGWNLYYTALLRTFDLPPVKVGKKTLQMSSLLSKTSSIMLPAVNSQGVVSLNDSLAYSMLFSLQAFFLHISGQKENAIYDEAELLEALEISADIFERAGFANELIIEMMRNRPYDFLKSTENSYSSFNSGQTDSFVINRRKF